MKNTGVLPKKMHTLSPSRDTDCYLSNHGGFNNCHNRSLVVILLHMKLPLSTCSLVRIHQVTHAHISHAGPNVAPSATFKQLSSSTCSHPCLHLNTVVHSQSPSSTCSHPRSHVFPSSTCMQSVSFTCNHPAPHAITPVHMQSSLSKCNRPRPHIVTIGHT